MDWSIHPQSPPRFGRIVDPVSGCLQRLQLDHRAACWSRNILFRMGTRHSIRAVHDPPLHVDRSFLCRRAVSLSNRKRIVDLRQTCRRRDFGGRNLLPTFSPAFRFSATARRWLARRNLRLVSRNGCALQSSTFVARGAYVDPSRCLLPPQSWAHSNCDHCLVLANRRFAGSHLSTSRRRYCRRFRSRGLLLLPFPRKISPRLRKTPNLIIRTRHYELQRLDSTLLRALDRDAVLLEPLRSDRRRVACVFVDAQAACGHHDSDGVDPLRLVRLQKSRRDVRYDCAKVCDDPGDQTIRFQWGDCASGETGSRSDRTDAHARNLRECARDPRDQRHSHDRCIVGDGISATKIKASARWLNHESSTPQNTFGGNYCFADHCHRRRASAVAIRNDETASRQFPEVGTLQNVLQRRP